MDTFKKSTRAYALCTNKEENLRDWKERWLDTVRIGRFCWIPTHHNGFTIFIVN
jgi:hypothetical protein